MIAPGIKKLIESNALSFATVDGQGRPHSIAVAYVKVIGNKIIITNTHINKSLKNIEKNYNVALTVWNKEWETACVGFEISGTAKNYRTGKWFDLVKSMPDNEGYDVKSAIVVLVKKIKKLLS
jgi:predicted pyridoxine 5'-phosphate oxidase superfamily flavin-nucleotide-binding protein